MTFSRSSVRMTEKQAAALLRRRDTVIAVKESGPKKVKQSHADGSGPEKRMAATLKIAGVQGWERELAFHPVRAWRFDFAWPDALVALEIEGGVFSGGRHARGAGIREDMRKYNEAQLLGWIVIRILPEWIKKGQALLLVERALALRTPKTGSAGIPRSTVLATPTGERSTATPQHPSYANGRTAQLTRSRRSAERR